jgi:hypothetical protein
MAQESLSDALRHRPGSGHDHSKWEATGLRGPVVVSVKETGGVKCQNNYWLCFQRLTTPASMSKRSSIRPTVWSTISAID